MKCFKGNHIIPKRIFQFILILSLGFPIGADNKLSKKFVNYTGDIMLGALFPIHRRGMGKNESICNKVQSEDGIQPLEALLYTIDKINRNDSILPGIKIGVIALDTCDSTQYALEQSLDFIKGFIAQFNEFPSENQNEFQCSDHSVPKFRNGDFDRIVGLIGGQSSSVSIQVANLLRLFKIPQISYMSTSPQLSNRDKFPYFFRTVPSDVNQAHAILDILRYFNWTYVAVIYSDSEYGIHCYETLRDVAANDTICFTTPHRVIRDQFKSLDYDQIIRNINNIDDIRVIILILEKEYTKELMQAATRLHVKRKYVWIGTDAWSNRESVVLGHEDIVEGAIAIQPLVSTIEGFDEYFTSLTPDSHGKNNPWFDEFWEDYFHCKLDQTPVTEFNKAIINTTCSSSLRISTANGYFQQSFIHFVRDSVYAFAYALHNMHQVLCNGEPGLCPEMQHIDGIKLADYLKRVTFKDEEESLFRFMNVGDGPTRYTIVNFQRVPENGTYKWTKVGNYSLGENENLELKLDGNLRYRLSENGTYPASNCAQPCSPYEIKVRENVDSCCWKCRPCGSFAVKSDDFHCTECEMGFRPDEKSHSQCLPIPEEYIDYRNAWAIGAMGIATLGILITTWVGLVFWNYNETPIIKAAGRELSYVLLFGILLSFAVTFIIVAEPNQITCGMVRFFLGFCHSLCYSAIVTKTNRIARIFHPKPGTNTPKTTKYISPTSQMIIVGLLTSVDIVINVVWIYLDPPAMTWIYPNRHKRIRICEGLETYSYMIGCIYPVILIGFCTIYAIKTRKCPCGFNETKYIAFTNYTIIIIWLAFVPLYIASTSNSIRVVALAISLSLSGLVELSCLFFPKIYIVLFKPEKNTKEVVMAPNRSSFLTLSNSASTSFGIIPSGCSNSQISGSQLQQPQPQIQEVKFQINGKNHHHHHHTHQFHSKNSSHTHTHKDKDIDKNNQIQQQNLLYPIEPEPESGGLIMTVCTGHISD